MKYKKRNIVVFVVFVLIIFVGYKIIDYNVAKTSKQRQMNEEVLWIIEYAQNILELKVPYEETVGTPFQRYNDILRYPEAKAKSKIKYTAELEENDGIIRVIYSQKISDKYRVLHECEDIESEWEVKKINEEWRVVMINEAP